MGFRWKDGLVGGSCIIGWIGGWVLGGKMGW